ncbi:phospholipase D family protein [Salmonella enterica]|nr:phospholipase D family protein [Salmonella enterica]
MDLYTNRASKNDFIKNGIINHIEDGMDLFFATAFFTESDVVDEFLVRKCHLRIVVRLGFPTSPVALEKLLNHENVEARFFTSNSFHPKLYIFGDKTILLGSANLTRSATLSNQEVMVGLDAEDHRFAELQELFADYWDEAEVLTRDIIKKYSNIYSEYSKVNVTLSKIGNSIAERIGDVNFSNISRGSKKTTNKSIFLSTYQKSYQEAVTAFRRIENVYKKHKRKVDEELIPLRLEIDSFFSFVRVRHATQDAWEDQPFGWNEQQEYKISILIDEWLTTKWEHFEEQIVPVNYPLIKRILGSTASIKSASMDDIVDALCVLHSFHDRFRFFKGGLETLKSSFIEQNGEKQVKHTLTYLLYGTGDTVSRMVDCIYDREYKLNHFGKSNIQELIGWINQDELPVINGRTTKVLRYFGNQIRQIDE